MEHTVQKDYCRRYLYPKPKYIVHPRASHQCALFGHAFGLSSWATLVASTRSSIDAQAVGSEPLGQHKAHRLWTWAVLYSNRCQTRSRETWPHKNLQIYCVIFCLVIIVLLQFMKPRDILRAKRTSRYNVHEMRNKYIQEDDCPILYHIVKNYSDSLSTDEQGSNWLTINMQRESRNMWILLY